MYYFHGQHHWKLCFWAYGLGGLNQHIFKVTSANDFPKSFFYFQLLDYVDVFKKMAEAKENDDGAYYARPFTTKRNSYT